MAHKDRQAIIEEVASLNVKPGQRYQHYKTRGIYVVDKIVVLEANEEPAVAYYDQEFPDLMWIRPYSDFTAQIDAQTTRFSLLS